MKSASFIFIFFTATVSLAQQSPFLLNRLPYVSEESSSEKPMLNTASVLSGLEPLPDFNLPQQLPYEFSASAEQKEIIDLLSRASQHLAENNPEQAVTLLRQALELQPEEVNLQVSLADGLYAADQVKEAKNMYENVVEASPLHFQALNNLGWLLTTASDPDLKNPDKALRLASQAKLIRPNSHHVWSTISQVQFDKRNFAEAERSINRAIRLAQRTGVTYRVLAGYLIHRDRCVLAREATSLLE